MGAGVGVEVVISEGKKGCCCLTLGKEDPCSILFGRIMGSFWWLYFRHSIAPVVVWRFRLNSKQRTRG